MSQSEQKIHQHLPVLATGAVDALVQNPDGKYVDGTFGRGGHSRLILGTLSAAGRLTAIDKDPDAIALADSLAASDPRLSVCHGSFARISDAVNASPLDGVLLDLGVSSPQLDAPERGFSFMQDGPLDMRMDVSRGESAAQWLSRASEEEISRVLWEYGEERFSRRIAKAIVRKRTGSALATTAQLAEIVVSACPKREKGKHPATRSFQAIRIQVNSELDDLRAGLESALELLVPGGRLVVISFHSLEDRIVKRFIRSQASGDPLPRRLPVRNEQLRRRLRPLGKAVRPSEDEVAGNPRARSAVMRVAEKLQD